MLNQNFILVLNSRKIWNQKFGSFLPKKCEASPKNVKFLLNQFLKLDDVNDFRFALESDLANLVQNSYAGCSDEFKANVLELI